MKFGSVCSGIEAASIALKPLGYTPLWFSEIADFPSRLLKHHYPNINNLGDMNNIAELIKSGDIEAPELLCGGTPCQAFSLAGWKKGLVDKRGQLTISFIDIADAIDQKREEENKTKSIILWENVEGILKDKTNAFGIFIAGLAGLTDEIKYEQWPSSGALFGPKRNIVWRVLDAKFFGLPHQRRRLFLLATDKNISPANMMLEITKYSYELFNYKTLYKDSGKDMNSDSLVTLFETDIEDTPLLVRHIRKNKIEVFRQYTDCLYSAYGTKWNGNAAAYNGSLYISQNDNVRRLTPLECERLMGFPDNYTLIPNNKDTNRYQAVGNSWPIPVINWIGQNILKNKTGIDYFSDMRYQLIQNMFKIYLLNDDFIHTNNSQYLNTSPCPNKYKKGNIFDIVDLEAQQKFYISSKGSDGILRRKQEREIKMNIRLEELFSVNSGKCFEMPLCDEVMA